MSLFQTHFAKREKNPKNCSYEFVGAALTFSTCLYSSSPWTSVVTLVCFSSNELWEKKHDSYFQVIVHR